MKKIINIKGNRFFRLVALEYVGEKKWLFLCDCGNKITILSSSVKSGKSKSCGCLRKEKSPLNVSVKHGMKHTRIHRIWTGMKSRCRNKTTVNWHIYGGKGISVCKEWELFIPFYIWSIKNGYKEDLSIDRIDNNKNYCPENCRWSTITEQNNNKSNNILFNGETARHASRRLGGCSNLVQSRINTHGWSLEKAFKTSVDKTRLKK